MLRGAGYVKGASCAVGYRLCNTVQAAFGMHVELDSHGVPLSQWCDSMETININTSHVKHFGACFHRSRDIAM